MKKDLFEQRRHQSAFTFAEFVVILFIMALLFAAIVPRLMSIYDQRLLEEQVRLLEKDLIWLKSEARRTNEMATFRRQDQHSYTLTVNKTDGAQSQQRDLISERLAISTNSYRGQVVFQGKGTAFEKCTIKISCGTTSRTLVVNNMGQIRVGVDNGS